jgi:hypothetical protein
MDKISDFRFNKKRLVDLTIVIYLWWLVFLSACGVQTEINSTNISSTPIQGTGTSPVETPTVMNHQLLDETVTTTPTSLSTIPLSPTPTMTPVFDMLTITPTETAVPPLPTRTLNAEELRQKWLMIDDQIAAIMASNDDCGLPCWWGIEPGNLLTDALQIFNMVNENGWFDSPDQWGELQQIGFFKHNYRNEAGEDLSSTFSVGLIAKADQVEVIRVSLQPHTDSHPSSDQFEQVNELLLRDWEQYTVQNMFETFGEPTLIYLLPRNFADGDDYSYDFNIYYPTDGVVASYAFPLLNGSDGEQTMCLDLFNLRFLRLYLFDPALEFPNSYLLDNYPLWPLGAELTPDDIPLVTNSDLESRTGLSIVEFVTLIMDNENDMDCFTVN